MTSGTDEPIGQRVIRILVDSTDPSDPTKYTFTDDSNDPPKTLGETVDGHSSAGNIDLGTAESDVATTLAFILSDDVHNYAAWNTDDPTKNVIVVAGEDCPPAGSQPPLPDGWKVMVSSDGRVLSVYDPNAAGTDFAYRLNLKGRRGKSGHDVTIDPIIKNRPV